MNPLVLLFMALVTFLLGVIALALLPGLLLTAGLATADALWFGVLGAVILGVVIFGGAFLVSLSNRTPGDGPRS